MKIKNTFLLLMICLGPAVLSHAQTPNVPFEPTWDSLNQYEAVPEWFRDAKFGIYFHWGVYSVPAFANEWYPRSMFIKGSAENLHHIETYGDPETWPYDKFITGAKDKLGNDVQFAPKLKSEGGRFDPDEWAQLFADAGAKFAGPVAEHHDGFSMWASKVNPWNAKTTGPELDLVGLLTDAIRKKNMKVILSMHHAYNITGFYDAVPPTDDPQLKILYGQQEKEKNEALWLAKHKEIIDNYRPDIIWQDFNLSQLSQPVLLAFLSYYYNKAAEWNKPVVATYKDALNKECAVLDFERGGPVGLTDYYWLTDDAISSSSWCYTEGIGYYSAKQVLHGFIDKISKNGNLLLNISPRADGTIPREQKDILLAMGDWLRKYGEAVYATRAWQEYGEGPTKMGAGHGVFTAPAEGTAEDISYTRSKDNKTLYAILSGWKQGQKDIVLRTLSSGKINLESLNDVSLINGAAGKYLPLKFRQDTTGLIIDLPEKSLDDPAYVLKLRFDGTLPVLDKYAELDCSGYYYLVPEGVNSGLVLGNTLQLSADRKNPENQWALKHTGKGFYQIINRQNLDAVLECRGPGEIKLGNDSTPENRLWKFEKTFDDLLKISSRQYPGSHLIIAGDHKAGSEAGLSETDDAPVSGWRLQEVCDREQVPFKALIIPGIIEAEDFDIGCPGDAYYDQDEVNAGGRYRPEEGVDIEVCSAGGFNTGWSNAGEWMAYTLDVVQSGNYLATFYVASTSDNHKFHLEFDGIDKTGPVLMINTKGFQNWGTIQKPVSLTAGRQVMKLMIDEAGAGMNFDKISFEAIEQEQTEF